MQQANWMESNENRFNRIVGHLKIAQVISKRWFNRFNRAEIFIENRVNRWKFGRFFCWYSEYSHFPALIMKKSVAFLYAYDNFIIATLEAKKKVSQNDGWTQYRWMKRENARNYHNNKFVFWLYFIIICAMLSKLHMFLKQNKRLFDLIK